MDPLLHLLLDKDVIDVVATLIAKMERLTYDDIRTSIFRTAWAKKLWMEASSRILADPLDIDEWYRMRVMATRAHRDIDGSLYSQAIDTDWITALLDLELNTKKLEFKTADRPSVLRILYSILELEDTAHAKLALFCKSERQYDLLGISKTQAGQKLLTPGPAPPMAPGSKESLIFSTRPKQ
jgi:hypothetical protein